MALLGPLFVCLWGMVTFVLAVGVFIEQLEEGDPRAAERGLLVGALWLPAVVIGLAGSVLFVVGAVLGMVAGLVVALLARAVFEVGAWYRRKRFELWVRRRYGPVAVYWVRARRAGHDRRA